MRLLQLPPEILEQIFNEIGSSFFFEDVGRLTVCKTWFEFARPVQFKSLKLTRDLLKRLISSEFMDKSSLIQRTLVTLDLEFRGFRATPPVTLFENPFIWINDLNSNLSQFVTRAHQCRRLRILRMRAWYHGAYRTHSASDGYLSLPIMLKLLSLGNLSVLVLDINADLYGPRGEPRENVHFCPAVAALLPTLQTLHIRLQFICPDILEIVDSYEALRLSTLVINTTLIFSRSGATSASPSRRCLRGQGELLQLRSDLQEQAEALSHRMSSPKIVRLLTHKPPTFETLSLDVLTGATMILDDSSPWDADGKIVEEDTKPESELSDSDWPDSSEE